MNDWQWFEDFEAAALARGDRKRARMRQIHRDAYQCRETNPDRTLFLLAEGRLLAQTLKEPWWVLLFDHWLVHITLYNKCDYRNVLEPAVRNVLEVRKPEYAGFPQKLWMLGDLIQIYVCLDPLSFVQEIEQSLAELNVELPAETDSAGYLFLFHQLDAAVNQSRYDDALRIALQIRTEGQADPVRSTGDHYLIPIYRCLCHLYHLRGDWAEVAIWAVAGEELARQLDHKQPLCAFLIWQAVIAQSHGEKTEAANLYRSAISRMSRLKSPPERDYFDALCLYHELCGNPEMSLKMRVQEVETFVSQGRGYDEFDARLAKLRLLSRMGHDSRQDLLDARQMTRKFRRPECYLAKIEQITIDDQTKNIT